MENLDLLGKKYTSNEVYEIFGSFSALEKVIFPKGMTYFFIDDVCHIVNKNCNPEEIAKKISFKKSSIDFLKQEFVFDEDWRQWSTLSATKTSKQECLEEGATEKLRHFPSILIDGKYLISGLKEIKEVLALAS